MKRSQTKQSLHQWLDKYKDELNFHRHLERGTYSTMKNKVKTHVLIEIMALNACYIKKDLKDK